MRRMAKAAVTEMVLVALIGNDESAAAYGALMTENIASVAARHVPI